MRGVSFLFLFLKFLTAFNKPSEARFRINTVEVTVLKNCTKKLTLSVESSEQMGQFINNNNLVFVRVTAIIFDIF